MTESLFNEIMADNFPNMGRNFDTQVHEPHRLRNKLSLRVPSLRHIIIKLSKTEDKEGALKASRGKRSL